ncbi:MAG TPA: YhjD/YihY/BrkB family envelope integrity protein [Polyangiaceae bacterium]|nr:YhjD/YihY/BrkB family envelope integrity protein [Polyangiaceae bacterium]
MTRALERVLAWRREWLDPIVRGVTRARTFGLAAEMSYWLFLSLVPLAAVAGLVAARLATSHQPLVGSFLSSFTPEAQRLIEGQVASVAAWDGGRVAPVALGMFVWLASSGVHSVFDALEVQSETTRPWWIKRLLALATCVGLSMGIAFLGLLAIGFDRVAAVAGRAVALPSTEAAVAGRLARSACGAIVGVAMVAALYRLGIPRATRNRAPILPGALLAVALLAALGWGYRLYVSRMGIGDAYLGSLAVIGVTMTTLWLFSMAILLGTQLNTVLGDRQRRRPASAPHIDGRPPLAVTTPTRPRTSR